MPVSTEVGEEGMLKGARLRRPDVEELTLRRAPTLYRLMSKVNSEVRPETRFRNSGAKPGAYTRGAGRPIVC